MSFAAYSRWLSLVYAISLLAILILLRYRGSHRVFRFFFFYACFDLAATATAGLFIAKVGQESVFYIRFYETVGFVSYTLLVLASFELHFLVPIQRFAAWLWAIMPVTGLVLALYTTAPSSVLERFGLARLVILHVALYCLFASLIGLLRARPRINVGDNFRGILWFIGIALLSHWALYWIYAAGGFTYVVLKWLIQPSFLVGALTALYSLRIEDLPGLIKTEEHEEAVAA